MVARTQLLQGYLLQSSVEFIKFVDLSDEEVAVAGSHLGVRNVDHILVNVEINFRARLELSLQAGGALPEKILINCRHKHSTTLP